MMRSPKLAAMGVATLSGLIPVFFEPTMTPTMMMPDRTQIKQPGQHQTAFIPLLFIVHTCRINSVPSHVSNALVPELTHRNEAHVLVRPTIVCLPWSREAMKAVATLLEHSSTAWLIWNFPSGIQPSTTAATAARNPTTVACT